MIEIRSNMAKLKELNEKMLELSKPTIFIASNIQ